MVGGVSPPSTTCRTDCGRMRPLDLTIHTLRSPGLPSHRTSSQYDTTPPRAMGAVTDTPPHARAMVSGTERSGRCVTTIPRSPLPWVRKSSSRWKPGPRAPSFSSPGLRKEVRDPSKTLATRSRYSTAAAGTARASVSSALAVASNLRRNVDIGPPGLGMCCVARSMPSGTPGPRGKQPTTSRVEVLARGGRRPPHGVPLLAQEELIEADGAAREGHGGAGEVEEPRAIGSLAHDSPRLVGTRLQALDPLAAGARVVEAEVLHVVDFPARALHLRHGLGDAGEIAVGEHVLVEKIRLAGAPPVELVVDAVVEVEPAVVEHGPHTGEEARIVRDAHVLDHPDGGDLVVTRARGQIAQVAIFHEAAPLEALALDAGHGPVRLGLGEGYPVRGDAVVLHGPDAEPAPAAADVEQGLSGLEAELAAHEIDLVDLRLLELAVGLTVVGAGVGHERIQEEGVEVVGHVVVMGDGLGIPSRGPSPHDSASFIPKIPSNTMRRRASPRASTTRTARRASPAGSRSSWRPSQPGSPRPYSVSISRT